MKNFCRIFLSLFLLATGACAPDQDIEADATAIRQLEEDAVRAFNASDVLGLLAVYTEDAVWMPPHRPAVRGKEPIKEQYRDLFQRFTCQLSRSPQEIVVAGDWAFARGTYLLTMSPKAGGEPIVDEGKYLALYRRQSEGAWGLARHAWNSDQAPEIAAARQAAAAPAARAQPPRATPPRQPRFAVQLGAFEKRADAEALANKISTRYNLSVLVAPAAVGGREVYRVRIPAASKAEAQTLGERIGSEQKLKTWVVSLP